MATPPRDRWRLAGTVTVLSDRQREMTNELSTEDDHRRVLNARRTGPHPPRRRGGPLNHCGSLRVGDRPRCRHLPHR
jgi:hypothetical protein